MKRIMLLSTNDEPHRDGDETIVRKKLIGAKLTKAERALLICCTKFPFAVDERVRGGGTEFQLAVYLNAKYGKGFWDRITLENDFAKTFSMTSHSEDHDKEIVGSDFDVLLKAPCIYEAKDDSIDWLVTFDMWRETLKAPYGETQAATSLFKANPFLKAEIKKFDSDKM